MNPAGYKVNKGDKYRNRLRLNTFSASDVKSANLNANKLCEAAAAAQ